MLATPAVSAITTEDLQSIINNTPNYGEDTGNASACGSTDGSTDASSLPGGDNKQKAFNYFLDKGLSDVQAAAIVGNFIVESSLNTSADQPGGPGMGIAQWSNPGRWDKLQKYAAAQGKDKFDLGLQLDFVWLELQGTPPADDYSAVLKKLKTLSDVSDATGFFMGTAAVNDSDPAADAFMAKYGRVGGYENPGTPHLDLRIKAANAILGQLGGSDSGTVSGTDSSCGSVGAVNCNSTATASAAGSGSTSGLSQLRQNVVCLTKAELALWTSGKMKAGHDFFKYSEGRDELWCADFASWIYWKSGYPIGPSASDWNVPRVVDIQAIGQKNSKFHYHTAGGYTPKPGDMIIHLDGQSHVNIVVSVNTNSKSMTIIGGDQHGSGGADGNVVNEYTESINTGDDGITGYVSPD